MTFTDRSRPLGRLRRTLIAALCCTALALGTTPALAQDPAVANAPLGPATGGQESAQARGVVPEGDVLRDPGLPATPPTTGGANPGATLGQGSKPLGETSHLSQESTAAGISRLQQAGVPQAAAASAPPATGEAAAWKPAGILGMDVSGWQPTVDWAAEYRNGARFAYVKATEGTGYRSPSFNGQYTGAANAGMYRGAYHFALPSVSSGAAQADYFIANGGGWTADGRTMPGLLDVEFNPYASLGNQCFNMSPAQLKSWITSFANRYLQKTGRYPMIYTATSWWNSCIGSTSEFNHMPLHLANYSGSVGPLPSGWSTHDVWQYSASGPFSGDSNVYRGSAAQLRDLVVNAAHKPLGGRAPAHAAAPSGQVYTSSNGRQVKLSGAIGTKWNKARGTYGEPVNNESCGLVQSGCFQTFSKGYTIYWTPNGTGTNAVKTWGAIGEKWMQAGYERGYGYPLHDEACGLTGGGCYQTFSNGYTVYWTPFGTGTHAVYTWGAIGKQWMQAGYERGYGYPTTDRQRSGSGYSQRFSGGRTLTGAS